MSSSFSFSEYTVRSQWMDGCQFLKPLSERRRFCLLQAYSDYKDRIIRLVEKANNSLKEYDDCVQNIIYLLYQKITSLLKIL